MRRSIAQLLPTALALLACTGLPTTGPGLGPAPAPVPAPPPTPAPDPDPDPEPREGPPDCLAGVTGVLEYAPGFPSRGHKTESHPVDAFLRPNPNAKKFATIDQGKITRADGDLLCALGDEDRPCATIPWTLEGLGLPVYEDRPDWSAIGVGRGGSVLDGDGKCRRVWVHVEGELAVQPIEALLTKNPLTHTLDAWDGTLWDKPGGHSKASGQKGRVDFLLKSTKTVDDQLWLQVDVIAGHCGKEKNVEASGWMPAYDDKGKLQVWYMTDC